MEERRGREKVPERILARLAASQVERAVSALQGGSGRTKLEVLRIQEKGKRPGGTPACSKLGRGGQQEPPLAHLRVLPSLGRPSNAWSPEIVEGA